MSFVGIQNIPNQKDIFTPGWWQIFFSVCWNEVSYSWVIINPASITGEPNDPCIANLLVCFSRKTYTGPDALCLLRCQRTLKWCRERCAAESTAADKGRGVRSLVEFVMAGVGMHPKQRRVKVRMISRYMRVAETCWKRGLAGLLFKEGFAVGWQLEWGYLNFDLLLLA